MPLNRALVRTARACGRARGWGAFRADLLARGFARKADPAAGSPRRPRLRLSRLSRIEGGDSQTLRCFAPWASANPPAPPTSRPWRRAIALVLWLPRPAMRHTQQTQKSKGPGLWPGPFFSFGRRPTLPHTCACSTIGAEGLNFRVRDGNGCDPFATVTQNLVFRPPRPPLAAAIGLHELFKYRRGTRSLNARGKFYGQAERAISNG